MIINSTYRAFVIKNLYHIPTFHRALPDDDETDCRHPAFRHIAIWSKTLPDYPYTPIELFWRLEPLEQGLDQLSLVRFDSCESRIEVFGFVARWGWG